MAPLAFKDRPRLNPALYVLIPLTALVAYFTFNRAAWLAMLVESGLCLLLLSRRRCCGPPW